jgi:hypothetical protein
MRLVAVGKHRYTGSLSSLSLKRHCLQIELQKCNDGGHSGDQGRWKSNTEIILKDTGNGNQD